MTLTAPALSTKTLRSILVTLAATAGLAVAGCGSSDDDTTTAAAPQQETTPTAATATAVAPELLGTFERRVTAADIERTGKIRDESGPNQEKPSPGVRRLVIDGGTLRLEVRAEKPPLVIEQSISSSAEELSIEAYVRPEAGSFCGPEIPQNATYTWSREGAVLRLKAVGDPCADRDSELTGDWKPHAG